MQRQSKRFCEILGCYPSSEKPAMVFVTAPKGISLKEWLSEQRRGMDLFFHFFF